MSELTPKRILVIEDEPDLAQTLCYNLKRAGMTKSEETGAGANMCGDLA